MDFTARGLKNWLKIFRIWDISSLRDVSLFWSRFFPTTGNSAWHLWLNKYLMNEGVSEWMKWNWQGLIHTLVRFPGVNIEAKRGAVKPPHHEAQSAPTGSHTHPLVLKPAFFCFLVTLSWPLWWRVLQNRFIILAVIFPPSRALLWGVVCVYGFLDMYVHSVFALSGHHAQVSQLVSFVTFSLPFVSTYKDNFPSPIYVEPLLLFTFLLMYGKMQPCCIKHLWLFLVTSGNRNRSHLKIWHFSFMLSYLKL